jgi:DNA-binding transcriptional LysR family regulator
MEFRQLEYFVAVVEEENFTRAAARLHVAQPGVSAQIRLLERELGQELLERSSRGVRLTALGEAVLPYAQAALGQLATLRDIADEHNGLIRGQASVGTVQSCPSVDIPAILASFHATYPGVSMRLTEATTTELIAAVRNGSIDLAAVGLASDTPDDVHVQIIADEPLVAAVSPTHELADAGRLRVRDLDSRDLITLPAGSGMRACVESVFAELGMNPLITFEAGDPVVVCQLARQGLGVALVPLSVAQAYGQGLTWLMLEEPEVRERLALIWRRNGPVSRAAAALISHAVREVPSIEIGGPAYPAAQVS